MHDGPDLSVTVVIPVYGATPDQLSRCLRSVETARGSQDELIVVFDGAPSYAVEELPIPSTASVIVNPARLGLVANWNRCITLGTGEAIHLMHADDEIGPQFYRDVREAYRRWPDRAFVAAGASPGTMASMESVAAARFLLSGSRPPVGSVVYQRADVDRQPFSDAYPYCPDEETLPKLAYRRGIALVASELYRETTWDGQTRFATWHRDDFVDVYWTARMEGVGMYPASVREFARTETRARVISVCAHLIRVGDARTASSHLRALRRLDPGSTGLVRVMMAAALASVPGGRSLMRVSDLFRGRRG